MSIVNAWIRCFALRPNAHLRLFCFPYAGGGASLYREWSKALPLDVEVCSIQLPGREDRLREAPITSMPLLVQALSYAIRPYLDRPFAFWGHSMGALIAFELARLLRRTRMSEPSHLFVSGRGAPQLPNSRTVIHQLPESEFIKGIRRLNGTPEIVLQNRELMEVMLPTLRADFTLVETYSYFHDAPLKYSISAFGGLQDSLVDYADLEAWQTQTRQNLKVRMFAGDHFYLRNVHYQLLRIVHQDLIHTY